MRYPYPCDHAHMLQMCTDVHTYSIHREAHALAHTCTSTPRQAHIPTWAWRHSHTHAHIQFILVHMCTASHIHAHRDSVSSCSVLPALLLGFCSCLWPWSSGGVSTGSGPLILCLPSGPSLSCISLQVKGEPQALGSRESSLYVLLMVLPGWLLVRRECCQKSGEALGCVVSWAPSGHPKIVVGASEMQIPEQVKHSRASLEKYLWRRKRAGELRRLGEASSTVLSHPEWRKEKGRKAVENHPLGLCTAQGSFYRPSWSHWANASPQGNPVSRGCALVSPPMQPWSLAWSGGEVCQESLASWTVTVSSPCSTELSKEKEVDCIDPTPFHTDFKQKI